MGRTPASIAMKLVNLASLDPAHQARGIKGLTNISSADRAIWIEFTNNPSTFILECEDAVNRLTLPFTIGPEEKESSFVSAHQSTEREVISKMRIGQSFFRHTVLCNYGLACCICSLPVSEFLVASHIIPWSINEQTRLDPRNGLCLCVLHDKAFDLGFITVNDSYAIQVSSRLTDLSVVCSSMYFGNYDGNSITLPDKFIPKHEYLAWHRSNRWLG